MLDYAESQRNPAKHLTGITVVVVVHLLVAWALVSGLARQAIDVIKGPLETKIIKEPPKPPPETLPPPPPKLAVPPPTFIPPPEVQITAPAPAPVIQQRTVVAPPVYAAPKAPPAAAGPSNAVGVACPNSQAIRAEMANKYPMQARREGLSGEVLVTFVVTARGEIKDATVKSSSNRIFNSVSLSAVRQFNCVGQGQDVIVEVPFVFKLTD